MSKVAQYAKKTILMIGAPGVGKGTYSRMLSKDLNIPELSSGDELRKLVKIHFDSLNSECNQKGNHNHNLKIFHNTADQKILQIKTLMDEGKLIDDEYVHQMMKERLIKEEYDKGVILDGYPRTYAQAKEFIKLMKMDLVVKIELKESILIDKLLGRRVCGNCGKGYNICRIKDDLYDMAPLLPKKKANQCDECGGNLIQRQDDNIKTIRGRLALYNEMTKPLEDYYQDQNLVVTFQPKKGIDDYPVLLDLIKEKLI